MPITVDPYDSLISLAFVWIADLIHTSSTMATAIYLPGDIVFMLEWQEDTVKKFEGTCNVLVTGL